MGGLHGGALGQAATARRRRCAAVAGAVRSARHGTVSPWRGSAQAGARGEEDRPGRARCATGAGPKGGVPGWRARPGEQGARGGRGPGARQRRRKEREEREGEGKEKERKEKRKWKKEKKKEKGGGKKKKKEREREIRAGITALIAEPVGHAWRPCARVEGKTGRGCRVFGEIERSGGTGKIPENWG